MSSIPHTKTPSFSKYFINVLFLFYTRYNENLMFVFSSSNKCRDVNKIRRSGKIYWWDLNCITRCESNFARQYWTMLYFFCGKYKHPIKINAKYIARSYLIPLDTALKKVNMLNWFHCDKNIKFPGSSLPLDTHT